MTFGTPQALWLFLLVPFFVLLHYKSFSDMGVFQRRLSLALRLILLAAIILAVADAKIIRRSDNLAVFYLWDGSRSMGEGTGSQIADFIRSSSSYADPKKDTAGLIAFGRDALVENGLGSDLKDVQSIQSDLQPDFTNISGAIDLALASAPEDAGVRLVLLTDGNENLGDVVSSARMAANRGVQICPVPFGQPTQGEVAAGRIILPRRAEENELFDVRAVIESEAETDATVEVYENERLIGSQQVHLTPGKNVFTFPRQQTQGGFYSYRIHVLAQGDVQAENNNATDYTIVQGAPRICYVSGDPNEHPNLVNALTAQGIQADFRDISGLPTSLIDMAPYDVIYFSDVGALYLGNETMRAYQSFVRDLGGGFAMIGGEDSFGPGGYYKTPIEEMLPVTMDVNRKEYMPSIAIAVVLDKSGSMGETEMAGDQKVDIAKEACALIVELLEPYDQFGVIGFDSLGQWVVPIGPVDDPDNIKAQIGTMAAGGGTSMYAPMQAAYEALQGVDTQVKHMIIASDGMTEPGPFDELIARMNADNITVSTIAIGTDADTNIMQHLASVGGGNYYFCNDINTLPQIFTKETFLSGNRALVEEPFQAVENQVSPITEDIDWSGSPNLLGYVATTAKPLSIQALVTHRTDPLLTHWQYGLGRSLAFASDAKSRWAASWLNWPGYSELWTKASRWLVGGALQGNLIPNIYLQAGKAHISVDAIDPQGEMITDAVIKARVVMPDMTSQELDLFQTAPGRYEATVDATQIGSYLTNVYRVDDQGQVSEQVSSGFSVSYPPEFERSGPDTFMLSQIADITKGQLGISPEAVFNHTNQPISHYLDLWYYLLVIAICLLPLDIAVRRLSLTGESLQYVRQQITNRMSAIAMKKDKSGVDQTHIDQLKKIKEKYRLDTQREDNQGEIDLTAKLRARTRSQLSRPLDVKTDTEIRLSDSRRTKITLSPDQKEVEGSLDRLKKAKKRVWDQQNPGDDDSGRK